MAITRFANQGWVLLNEAQRTALIAGVSATALLVSSSAMAQPPADPIAYCKENTDSKNERIACLETAIRSLMNEGTQAVETPTESEPALAETAPLRAPKTAAEPTGLGAEQVARRERKEEPAVSVAKAEETEKKEEAPEAQAADAAAPTGLGAEQVAKRRRSADKAGTGAKQKVVMTANVTDFARTSLGKTIFFLDNGQIWRQKTSDQNRIRLSASRKYTVEIFEGMISGYRLKINELNRTILVERIK